MKARLAVALSAALALAACDSGPTPEQIAAQRAQKAEQDANLQLQHFNEAKDAGRNELALNFADYILRNHPQSAAAKTVKPAADALRAKLGAESETRRLRDAWAYHDGEGVNTAYVYSKDKQARLVLRRHPEWGDDVYVLSETGKITCGTPCTVTVQFDDGPVEAYPGKVPETGEPAIFVEDFKKFVPRLPAAKLVRIGIVLQDGGAKTPEFEVAEYSTATIGNP
jgi:hypothetical protein